MKKVYTSSLVVMLFLGLLFHVQSLAAIVMYSPEEIVMDHPFTKRHFALQDAAAGVKEYYGYTEEPDHPPLEIVASDVSGFEYMAVSPYYKVFFKGTTVKMVVQDAWIAFELTKQDLGEINTAALMAEQNSLSVSNVFDSVDLSYEVDTSLLTEVLMLRESKEFDRIIQEVSWEGMNPVYEEDGSILFLNEEKELLKILPPFMKDAEGSVCEDIHYEVMETETGYELHKVIDEQGLKWLEQAVYPVAIDPSMQTFEDAWESSGLTPYGQYFQNLKEYVNPSNGHLTITQTDLVIPGRGLDLVISRIYETPAVFYGSNPYDYEAPPTDVGYGWQLDFPYVGDKYLHLWGGSMYKIEWNDNQFENHVGTHFILVKNGDNTYTLTTANGTVYTFSTSGALTKIEDLDQNTITFSYSGGDLTTITDTIGRTVNLSYTNDRLWKITYNGAELEYGYNGGKLVWADDFLNRRTTYYYTGYWLINKIEYITGGYTTYTYGNYSDSGYYKYHVTHQKVYETNQVRHHAFSYTGSFIAITYCIMTVKNESDTTKGSYEFSISASDGLIITRVVKNASGTVIRKHTFTYNSQKHVTQVNVYNDGSNLSYSSYYAYDNWGNTIYVKNAEGHEQFFSYANTSTSGFFMDNNGTIIRTFTNAFSNCTVPSSVHSAIIGAVEKQDNTYVKETYFTYDSEAHPTQNKSLFGNYTTWLTFSGTFNEYTGQTNFPIDLTGYTVTGNAALQITGLASSPTYQENHSVNCPPGGQCKWCPGYWSNKYYKVTWMQGYDYGTESVGPFTHYPNTLGYQSYTTNPTFYGSQCTQQCCTTFTVTTNWKAYPVKVDYNVDSSPWETVSTNLRNGKAQIAVPITDGSHTLYFSESSSYQTKFSWNLWVPVDNTPATYTTTMQYDTYGNITSITDPESNTTTFTYSSNYSYAYLTEISATVGQDIITTKATYDSNRGWITSIQEPKGVAGSGYDYLFTYDALGRIIKKEFPLLPGQSERTYVETIYNDANRTVTIIDQLRHYITHHYDKLGRLTDIKLYTGQYGSGTLYATRSYEYQYDDMISSMTDLGNDTYTLTCDFLGRYTQIQYPDSSSVSCLYDDANGKVTFTNERGYRKIFWYDWLDRITKVEEEYATDSFAVTVYQYDEIGHLTSFTDAENHTTTYTYASFYGLTKTVYPDSEYEEYEYDNTGNITSSTDANGNETQLLYDDLYRLIEIQYEDQSTVSFTYDLNSNLIKMEDDAPNSGDYSEYTYDYWNRLTSTTRHISQTTYTVSYQRDAANRLTKLTYPDNMQILYAYDDLNRTTEIKRYVDGSDDEILMDNVQYNTEGLLTQFDYGNDLQATITYNSSDRPLTIDIKDDGTSYLDLDYTYDDNNNITQLINGWRDTNSTWHSQTESYSYDGLDRLTSASCMSWSHTYSYDKVGNRTAKDSVTYTINIVNEVIALSDGASFTYDSNGNITQKSKGEDTWAYTYDYGNRLTKVEKNSTTLGEYVYDGGSKRIQVTEDSVTTTYIYSGVNVLYEENTTGTAAYIYGPTGRLAKITTINEESNTFYYHTDQLGSTQLVTDNSKNIVSAVTYRPFGEAYSEEGSESYLFNGKEKDSTDLYYYGARYYDPEIGRFITRDPLCGTPLNPQSLNRYTYCTNNPLKYVDPVGLDRFDPNDGARADYHDSKRKNRSARGERVREWLGGSLNFSRTRRYPKWGSFCIILITDIYYNANKTFGIAVGCTARPINSRFTYDSWAVIDWGLVIFFFDEDGNIIDIMFIPFSDLEDDMEHWWGKIKEKLGEHNVSIEVFYKMLDELLIEIDEICDMLAWTGGGYLVASGLALASGPIAPALGVIIFSGAVIMFVEYTRWDGWRDLLHTLRRRADEDR